LSDGAKAAIQQAQGIRRVAGSERDFQLPAAQIDDFAIVDSVGYRKRLDRIFCEIEPWWQRRARAAGTGIFQHG
jgi:hypothetical protein